MLPCLLCCPLSDQLLSCFSYMHLSILGLAVLFFFSLVHPHRSSILLTMCSSFILLTWPYHFSRFSIIFLDACTTLMCSFRILSLLATPHIHLSILISFTSSRASCPLVVAQVSAPNNRADLTTVSDHSFVNLPLQLHWHPPVKQHSTASLPVSPCCTQSLRRPSSLSCIKEYLATDSGGNM